MQGNGVPGLNLGDNWTPLARAVILTKFGIFVAQMVSRQALDQWLAWQPFGEGFYPWQVVTALALSPYHPWSAFLEWLGLFFLLAPVERALGRTGLVRALGASWLLAVTLTVVGVLTGLFDDLGFVGVSALLGALLAHFGFTNPHATVYIFFVVPVRASLLAWGTGLIAFLFLLYAPSTWTGLAFFAWGGAWAWHAVPTRRLGAAFGRWRRSRAERDLRRFQVIEGGRRENSRNKDVFH